MYYLIRSSEVGGSVLRHALIDFDGDIQDLRTYIKEEFSDILDANFLSNMTCIDKIDKVSHIQSGIINDSVYNELRCNTHKHESKKQISA
ncbi:hypothetical protein LAT59_02090 [Candidatus Gracilibacteria bacterium]|nr:hypothetical protein [Candidatus Gracilibacteria bacterium]